MWTKEDKWDGRGLKDKENDPEIPKFDKERMEKEIFLTKYLGWSSS